MIEPTFNYIVAYNWQVYHNLIMKLNMSAC